MAVTKRNIIKNWFKKYLKPTEQQFHSVFDSFWHKLEKIPMNIIDGLQLALEKKVDKEELEGITGKIRGILPSNEIELKAEVTFKYELPEKSKLFAMELKGNGKLEIGITSDTLGDLGEVEGLNGEVLQLGFISSDIYIRSTVDMNVVPILYKF